MNTRNCFSPIVVRPVMAFALLACCWLAITSTVSGQEGRFKAETVAEKFVIPPLAPTASTEELSQHSRRYRPQKIEIRNAEDAFEAAMDSGSLTPAASEYLTDYLFPSMTQLDVQSLSSLGQQRADFLKSYLDDDYTGPVRQQLIQLTLDRMTQFMVNPELHPAVRLNAAYLIGQLDSTPAVRGSQAPQPAAAAVQALVTAFTTDDPQRYPTFIKIAALAGIQRNAKIVKEAGNQLDQGVRDQVTAELNRLLGQPTSDDPTTYWLKRRAFQVGGLIGDSQTVQHMLDTLKSKDEPFWLQIDALNAINELSLLSVQPAENDAAANTITEFVVEALRKESKRVESKLDQLVFDNILFSDKDLVQTGSNFDGDAATGSPAGRGGGGLGRGGVGGGAPDGGGSIGGGGLGAGGLGTGGAGAGGLGAGGIGGGLGGGATSISASADNKLELPNYELDSVRSRLKSVAIFSIEALGKDTQSGLRRYLSPNAETMVKKVVADLETLHRKANLGIIDLDDRNREEPNPEDPSFTEQLSELCKKLAGDIAEHLPNQGGDDDPDGLRSGTSGDATGE